MRRSTGAWVAGVAWSEESRSRATLNLVTGRAGLELDSIQVAGKPSNYVRYDMCAVQRAMRWMNPTGCWKAMCLDRTRKLGNAKPHCRMKLFSV